MTMQKKPASNPKVFAFYLEAWRHCYHNNIDISNIVRVNWKTWTVVGDK